ncbi:MAG: condensation domain-containing protein, partial [Micromonosporaceae bacterium]
MTSIAQDGFWFLSQLAPESPAYNLCRLYRVVGRLSVPALRAAWFTVVSRHEILRARFPDVDGLPVPENGPPGAESFSYTDLRMSPGDCEARAARECARRAATPCDPAKDPLATMHVIHTGAETCRILLLLHHMITDNRSVSLLVREVSAEYLLAALPAMPPHHARSPLAPHRLTPPPPAP